MLSDPERKKLDKRRPVIPPAAGYKSKQENYSVGVESIETARGTKEYLIPKPKLERKKGGE